MREAKTANWPRRRRLGAACFALAALTTYYPSRAQAEPGDIQWSTEFGSALVAVDNREAVGGSLSASRAVGQTASRAWILSGRYRLLALTSSDPTADSSEKSASALHMADLRVGYRWSLDVLKIIPYVELSAGPMVSRLASETKAHGAFDAAAGYDKLSGRDFSWGGSVHVTAFAPRFDSAPVALELLFHATWRFPKY